MIVTQSRQDSGLTCPGCGATLDLIARLKLADVGHPAQPNRHAVGGPIEHRVRTWADDKKWSGSQSAAELYDEFVGYWAARFPEIVGEFTRKSFAMGLATVPGMVKTHRRDGKHWERVEA